MTSDRDAKASTFLAEGEAPIHWVAIPIPNHQWVKPARLGVASWTCCFAVVALQLSILDLEELQFFRPEANRGQQLR